MGALQANAHMVFIFTNVRETLACSLHRCYTSGTIIRSGRSVDVMDPSETTLCVLLWRWHCVKGVFVQRHFNLALTDAQKQMMGQAHRCVK